ncbi:hypothetical protein POM88_005870 [Heracleum sosnowskyi]|uniref:Uncharacterized protein n=1 Tax=Heracleum sosnowskyi TaxID=360622 RepID=A0AAD8J1L0_9APIA|nr:hypothetical protein POM88_005870 [Heracleum sosnowskyi]
MDTGDEMPFNNYPALVIQRDDDTPSPIKACELELFRLEDMKLVNSKNLGQKRVVQVTPNPQNKRRHLVKTTELSSMETRKDVEMRKCGVILEKMMNHKHDWVSNESVDFVGLGLCDYHHIVKRSMDLGTMLFDSTNEKFEAEVQSVIVEKQKFRKPLAEITKSQLVSS